MFPKQERGSSDSLQKPPVKPLSLRLGSYIRDRLMLKSLRELSLGTKLVEHEQLSSIDALKHDVSKIVNLLRQTDEFIDEPFAKGVVEPLRANYEGSDRQAISLTYARYNRDLNLQFSIIEQDSTGTSITRNNMRLYENGDLRLGIGQISVADAAFIPPDQTTEDYLIYLNQTTHGLLEAMIEAQEKDTLRVRSTKLWMDALQG
jgi:hypothetical protein